MNTFFTALVLAIVIEGIAYALFPNGMKRLMLSALAQPVQTLRLAGLAAAGAGVAVLWLIRG